MASRARNARRVGRARTNRIYKDRERTGDERRYLVALLTACGSGKASLVPSNWDQTITRKVAAWRTLYKHLSPSAMSRWYKIAAKLRIEDRVVINGHPVSLRELSKALKIVDDMQEVERLAQLAFYLGCCKGDVWDQVIED